MENEEKRKIKGDVRTSVFQEMLEWVKVILTAMVLAFLVNSFIIANSTIPTGSMENTIMPGARVFGLRLKYSFGEIKRGDVAIFLYGYKCRNDSLMYRETDDGVCPNCGREDSKNSKVYYVKRVIGMPGDHIEIKRTGYESADKFTNIRIMEKADGTLPEVPVGTLYVNGEAKEEIYLPEPMIVDGVNYPEIDVTVPEGHYYMLGDNRNNSADARFWEDEKFVKRERMIAPVYIKYWPLDDIGLVQ